MIAIDAGAGRSRPDRRLEHLMAAGDFAGALDWYREHAAVLTDPEAELMAARAAARIGDYPAGRALAVRALEGFHRLGDQCGAISCLNLEGGIHFELGNLDLAQQIFYSAVAMTDTVPDREATLAKLWNNLGSIAHLRGDDHKAIEHYADALEIYHVLGDDRGIAQTAHNLAVRLAAAGMLDRALEHATDAVHHAAQVADPALNALVIMGRAEIFLESGDWAAAQGDIFAALAAATDARDPLGVAEGLRLRAEVAFRRGEYDFARRQAEAAYRQAVEVGATITAAECGALLSLALKRLDRDTDALARYQDATARFRRAGALQPLQRFIAKWNTA